MSRFWEGSEVQLRRKELPHVSFYQTFASEEMSDSFLLLASAYIFLVLVAIIISYCCIRRESIAKLYNRTSRFCFPYETLIRNERKTTTVTLV
ncbi:hypothetical protein QR680_015759 [Steinernema hermaphroditum]|uniref:Uncharacterized protein n=1 Tax=Steinernema hermaphroditum TaxID=289476 RepID=A0AA39H8V4_9BILA|nr:hypothetical protein QR680_015759 [Steinernema hermaphroditum]